MAYTVEQENVLREAAPVNWEMAQTLATELGVSPRSIVAKVQQLGLEYVAKPAPERAPAKVTKAQMVAQIADRLNMRADLLEGLADAKADALRNLALAVQLPQ